MVSRNSSDVIRIARTNSFLLSEQMNIQAKNIASPFVYGIPMSINNSELVVLNTNGYIENINHFKTFFLTKFKLPSSLDGIHLICIASQNKIDIDKKVP